LRQTEHSAAITTALDFGAFGKIREKASGNLQVTFATDTAADNRYRFLATADPAVEDTENGFGNFLAKRLESSFLFDDRSLKFKLLQVHQIFENVLHRGRA
jgi:hypothetical protein